MIKQSFVAMHLSPLLNAIDHNIVCASYKREGEIEIVNVVYRNRHTVVVNVTCDSLAAIVKDVIKVIF